MCVIGVLQESRGKELQGSAQSTSVSLVLARNESPGTRCPGQTSSETSHQTAPRAIERLYGSTGGLLALPAWPETGGQAPSSWCLF